MSHLRPSTDRRVTTSDGGLIAAADWPGSKGPLLCVHGLTSSSRAFAGLANELADYRVVAVDCRGRGESSKQGPFGIKQHVADLLRIMDDLGIARATLVGHSMGAYIVGAFCAEHPERVERLVFVDGGYFLKLPPGVSADQLLQLLIGPFLEKMRRTWSSMDEYIRYYESSKLYPHGVDEYGRVHFEYDLTGTLPALRTKILEDCVAPDWRDVLDHAAVSERLKRVNVPLLLLRAPEGLTGNGDPVVPDDVRDEIVARVKGTKVVDIAGTNHHTILTSRAGAAIVAREIRTFTQDQ